MRTEIRCDRCGRAFMGDENLLDSRVEILCPNCWRDSNFED